MAILNNDYVVKRPSDYVSKLGISYQGMEDFYSPDKYNDGLYLLEKELENIELTDEKLHVVAEDKKLSEVLPTVARKGEILPQDIKGNSIKALIQNISMDENDNIAVDWINREGLGKKYSINLSKKYAKETYVAKKGEILPQDIKGNADYITSFLLPNLTSTGELEYKFVNGDGSYKSGFTTLSKTYAKKIDLESLQTTVNSIKQDIGGYAKRLETANNGIEARL